MTDTIQLTPCTTCGQIGNWARHGPLLWQCGGCGHLLDNGFAEANARAVTMGPAVIQDAHDITDMIDDWMQSTPDARPGDIGEAVAIDPEGAGMIITDAYSRLRHLLAQLEGSPHD
jgi:ribosomal protein L37AE/L43A